MKDVLSTNSLTETKQMQDSTIYDIQVMLGAKSIHICIPTNGHVMYIRSYTCTIFISNLNDKFNMVAPLGVKRTLNHLYPY